MRAATWVGRSLKTVGSDRVASRVVTRSSAAAMASGTAGSGTRVGYAHGTTDSQAMAPATAPVTPDDIAATIFHCLGIDPHMELQTPTGRPVQLFREGKVVEKLLA